MGGVSADTRLLRVDWPHCRGRGLCAEVFPERIGIDPWGYPVVTDPGVGPEVTRHAEVAVAVCPHQALRLVRPLS